MSSDTASTHLLQRFVQTGDETALRDLIIEFGGPVYSSALRRTGQREVAQEITQNVFVILSKKSSEALKSPSLAAWLFTVTKFESIRAMRTQRRHQRKLNALAQQGPEVMRNTDESPSWEEALPHLDVALDMLPEPDRDLLLARFSENKKFQDLAHQFGKSEDACKKRIKRALEKLNLLLTARGVTLSISTLTLVLGTELSRAMPGSLISTISTGTLSNVAASSAGSVSPLVFSTMKFTKISTILLGVVVLVGSLSIAALSAEKRSLHQKLTQLREQSNPPQHSRFSKGADTRPDRELSPVQKLISSTKIPLTGKELLVDADNAMRTRDLSVIFRLLCGINELSETEKERLFSEVINARGFPGLREPFASLLIPEVDPEQNSYEEFFERYLRYEINPVGYRDHIEAWVEEDSEAALAWFRKKRDEAAYQDGRDIGEGGNEYEIGFAAVLAGKLAEKDSEAAIKFMEEGSPVGRIYMVSEISRSLILRGPEERARARRLIENASTPAYKLLWVEEATETLAKLKKRDEGISFIKGMDLATEGQSHQNNLRKIAEIWRKNDPEGSSQFSKALGVHE